MTLELRAGADDAGRRLDRVLRKALPDHSLSLIHRLLRQGKAMLGGKKATPGVRVRPGDVIHIVLQDETDGRPRPSLPLPDAVLPPILWRGSGIIVFNKPIGLASHGDNSLDSIVRAVLERKLPPSLSFKPGPLHRLDKPTSGIIAFSETLEGAQAFSRLLRGRHIKKTYLAIVEGTISGEQTWQDELVRDKLVQKTFSADGNNGKTAVTHIRAVAGDGSYTVIEADIATGRTHQIRSQAAAHGHPLAGDVKYGGKRLHMRPAPGGGRYSSFYLHAWKMEIDSNAAGGIDGGDCLPGFPCPLVAPLPEAWSIFRHTFLLPIMHI